MNKNNKPNYATWFGLLLYKSSPYKLMPLPIELFVKKMDTSVKKIDTFFIQKYF